MITVAHMSSLYSAAQIVLWVEDTFTRDYLRKVWGEPPEIAFFIAGGSSSIRTIVQAAERERIRHVFGLVDRDFGKTNYDRWTENTASRVFTIPRHEMENYCLDAAAIQACGLNNRNRNIAEIGNELRRSAEEQQSWLACRRVLSGIRETVLEGFPEHPIRQEVRTIDDAIGFIVNSEWFVGLSDRVGRRTTPEAIREGLDRAMTDLSNSLATGDWLSVFSGKEIFRQIRTFVYQPPQNPASPDNDFAKAIGQWQYDNRRIPDELHELRLALRGRVGLQQ
jgi:Protein of unknown function (DUF4435)